MIDLHTHTNKSDGTLAPFELIKHAKDIGLSAIAITDHDTVSGIDEGKEAGKVFGIEIVEGVEIVAEYMNKEIHLLAYFLDYKGKYFLGKLQELNEIRRDRNERLMNRLTALNMPVSLNELKNEVKSGTITRLHFAKVMHNKGYVKSVKDAFDVYLEPGRPAFVGRNAFTYEECLEVIENSDGISVLAHPMIYGFNIGEVRVLIETLTRHGLKGIETVYPLHSNKDTSTLIKTADTLGLIKTGGSDFHGANKPDIKLGTGKDNITVEYSVLDELKKIRK